MFHKTILCLLVLLWPVIAAAIPVYDYSAESTWPYELRLADFSQTIPDACLLPSDCQIEIFPFPKLQTNQISKTDTQDTADEYYDSRKALLDEVNKIFILVNEIRLLIDEYKSQFMDPAPVFAEQEYHFDPIEAVPDLSDSDVIAIPEPRMITLLAIGTMALIIKRHNK